MATRVQAAAAPKRRNLSPRRQPQARRGEETCRQACHPCSRQARRRTKPAADKKVEKVAKPEKTDKPVKAEKARR
jgi:hypothetical protein